MQEEREKYGLVESDETIAKISQEKYRNLVKKKVVSHAVEILHAVASPHLKSDNLKNENFQRQAYSSPIEGLANMMFNYSFNNNNARLQSKLL